jgi:hypothetical protein
LQGQDSTEADKISDSHQQEAGLQASQHCRSIKRDLDENHARPGESLKDSPGEVGRVIVR